MNMVAERPGFYAVAGTPQEVREQLGKSDAQQVLAVSFRQLDPQAFQSLAENMGHVASSLLEALSQRQRLAEALVPPAPASPRLLREAAMLVAARKAVLASGDWLSATELASLAGFSPRNPSAQPNKWKRQGQIFAIHHKGIDYFPGFGLDPDRGFRPLKALADVIGILAGHKDGWGMAYWFQSVNGFLGGKRPQDLLATDPDRVIAAARDEVQGVLHG